MPRVRVDNVGTVGIVRDVPPYELPPNVWSDGQNVRMQDGSVHKADGWSTIWTDPIVAPYQLFALQTPDAYYWIYAGLNKVFAIQNKYHFDITRDSGDYNANSIWRWNGGVLGGVLVINNAVDVPQYWPFPGTHTNKLQDLTNWPSSDRCRILRPYKNYLVAFNIVRDGETYPVLVKWSHSTDIGTIPSSWDETDPTLDTGETFLPGAGGGILDAFQLRDSMYIYRPEATWAMQFIGGSAIFRFHEVFSTSGVLATGCVQEFFGQHLVLTTDDVVLHDGQQIQSLANNRIRRYLFNDMSESAYDQSFIVPNHADKEIWLCYPQSGSTLPNKALVWSYRENNWAFRDLPTTPHIAYGVVDEEASDTWDKAQGAWDNATYEWSSASGSWVGSGIQWDDDDKPWNYRTYDAASTGLMIADANNTKLYEGDTTNQKDGSNITAFIERTGLGVSGQDKVDLFTRKHFRAVYPHIEGTSGGVVNIYVGTQDVIGESVTYSTAKSFTLGTDYKVDVNKNGRLMALKFESTTDVSWRLHGYQIDLDVDGER